MGFVIVIDGPNFINDLERGGKDRDYFLNTLSLPTMQVIIQQKLNEHGLRSHPFVHTYFVCAENNQIGEQIKGKDKTLFLNKLKCERGVTVDEIKQSHTHGKEKQLDMNVFIRMLEMGPFARPVHDEWRHIVLISSDSDFVPAIRMLSQMGVHTILVGFKTLKNKEYPIELINESYLFLEISEILGEMEKIIK
jgi:uncharacterized LabA/DUF88 family protein